MLLDLHGSEGARQILREASDSFKPVCMEHKIAMGNYINLLTRPGFCNIVV